MNDLGSLDRLAAIASATSSEQLLQARAAGRPIVGYFCSYVPEEIITAAGAVPYRMRGVGSDSTALADVFFSPKNCTVPRHIFNKALAGDFCFLDGLIFLNSCDHTRRMYDNWRHAGLAPAFLHFLVVPHVITDLAREAYVNDITTLAHALVKLTGTSITARSLRTAIAQHNEKRELLRRLHAFLALPRPKLRMSEFVRVMLATTSVPVEKASAWLSSLTSEITTRPALPEPASRLVLAGGCMEEAEHVESIESLGVHAVADYICLGQRTFDTDIDAPAGATMEDLLRAVATRYLEHLSCPRMANDFRRRLQHIRETVAATDAEGVIAEKMTFCLLFGGETFLYREELRKHDIPLLVLEREYGSNATGQVTTRVQAFLEELAERRRSVSPRVAS